MVAADVPDAADAVAVVDTSATRRRWDYFVSYEEEDRNGGSYHVDHLSNTTLDKGLE